MSGSWPTLANPRLDLLGVATALVFGLSLSVQAQDIVEFKTGKKQVGRLISQDDNYVVMEVTVDARSFIRKYPKKLVDAVRIGAASQESPNAAEGKSAKDTKAASFGRKRSQTDVLDLINSVGKTPPTWFGTTPLDYPETLDLSWPEKPTGGWDSQKNVGQYVWDRINPNPSKWREGVKLMHHIMSQSKGDKEVSQRAMRALGTMYHNLHQDFARAAFWWHAAGLDANPSIEPHAAVHLANCYLQLGNAQMGQDLLKKMRSFPLDAIKLLGDLGQTDEALRVAEGFAKHPGNAVVSYLYAGDVCRGSGRLEDAERYYRQALSASDKDTSNKEHAQRNRQRAEANLAAIKFYKLQPNKIKDGTYTASSLGYEDQVHVEVAIKAGRIETVRVTQHREKQFYSSIEDTPREIIARQSIVVDTTSGATITSDAIINAAAKALAQGLK